MFSQNGWPASRDSTLIRVDKAFTVAGVTFPNGVRSGDVETVLRYLCEQFHSTVEHLIKGECWGYYYKDIEGSTTLSNHASATAVDLNAPKHPMGVRGTFTAAQRAAIRAILTYLGGVVRWGGDYVGRADEMHFEINADATAVAKVAAKIRLAKVEHMLEARDLINYPLKDPTDDSTHTLGDYIRYMEYNVRQQIREMVLPELAEIKQMLNALNTPSTTE